MTSASDVGLAPAAKPRDVVVITLPADGAYLSILRTATAGLASRLDFTIDEIEDLRIAVDEACAMLLPQAVADAEITCAFELDDPTIGVDVSVPTVDGVQPSRDTFAWTVLSALAGDVDSSTDAESAGHDHLAQARARIHAMTDDAAAAPSTPSDPPLSSRAAERLADRARTHELFTELGAATAAGDEDQRRRIRDELVELHLPLVEYLARRFRNRGEPLDDLVQVATIGLIKSIDRFDLDRGVEFSTYATPTIVGEIKRHFRDKGWAIRVPRRLQELKLSLTKATAELSQRNGRAPTVAELAQHLRAQRGRRARGSGVGQRLLRRVPGRTRARRRRRAGGLATRSARSTRPSRASSTASRSSRCSSKLPAAGEDHPACCGSSPT